MHIRSAFTETKRCRAERVQKMRWKRALKGSDRQIPVIRLPESIRNQIVI